jgi:ABC-2 type transport system permease protein
MSKLIQIALQDLRVFLVNRSNLIGLLAIPVAMTVVLGIFIPGGEGPSRVRVDVIDHDDGEVAEGFLRGLRSANDTIVLCPMDNDSDDFCRLEEDPVLDPDRSLTRVQEGDTVALIELPAGLTERVRAFEPALIRYVSVEDFSAPGFVRQAVDAALIQANGAVVAARVGAVAATALGAGDDFPQSVRARAAEIWSEKPISVQFELTAQEAVDPTSTPDIGGLGQSVPGMGSMFVLFTVLGSMGILVGEKKQWTLQRLASMPISRGQLLGGKILGRFALGLLQYAVVFAVGIVAGLYFGRDLLALVLIMISFTLAATALSFALGSRLTSEQQAAGLTNLLGLTLAPLGGAWWPLDIVPEFMRLAGHISPIAWAMDGYTSLMFRNGDLQSVFPSILALIGMAVVFSVFGIRRFRYELQVD